MHYKNKLTHKEISYKTQISQYFLLETPKGKQTYSICELIICVLLTYTINYILFHFQFLGAGMQDYLDI